MTFVYTKLALEEIDKGDILEVILDFPPAAKNIPENCKRQDIAEIMEKKELDSSKNIWQLKLRKLQRIKNPQITEIRYIPGNN